jgi:hypothetical protein
MNLSVKNILIGLAILFFIASVVTANVYIGKYKKEKAAKERVQENQAQLMKENADYKKITLTDKEFKQTMTKKVDSLLVLWKIKPKNVTTVIERHYYHSDTTSHTIQTDPVITPDGSKLYPFIDTSSCFKIGGHVELFMDFAPTVTINKREYSNLATSVGYIYRPYHFLFIKYGPWKGDLRTANTCGSETTKQIDIIKTGKRKLK